jgi:hypothetical protein
MDFSDSEEETEGAAELFCKLIVVSSEGKQDLPDESMDAVENIHESANLITVTSMDKRLRMQRKTSWMGVQSEHPGKKETESGIGQPLPVGKTQSQKGNREDIDGVSRTRRDAQSGNKLTREILKDLKSEENDLDLAKLSCGMVNGTGSGWSVWTDQLQYTQMTESGVDITMRVDKYREHGKYNPDQYPGVSSVLRTDMDMRENIGMTYLWSEGGAKLLEGTGLMPPHEKGWWTGSIAGEKIKILQDSGASTSFISSKVIEDSEKLKKCPLKVVHPPVRVEVASGRFLFIEQAINVNVSIAGHVFNLWAYVLPGCSSYQMLLGRKNMVEIEGGDEFALMEFHFKARGAPITAMESTKLNPGERKQVEIQIKNLPEPLKERAAVAHWTMGKHYVVGLSYIAPTARPGCVMIQNHTNQVLEWKAGSKIGSVDLRSIGLFHCSRDGLERAEGLMLLSENESQQCVQECMDHMMAVKGEAEGDDPYPWLDDSDERKRMTDEEIIRKYVNLDEAKITPAEKEKLYRMLIKYKGAFSLRDEIGQCPNLKVKIDLHDTTPFFIRPYPCTPENKRLIDKEMKKGVKLGVLRKGLSSYSSPVMLVPRPHGGDPRLVTDFRHLNARIVKLNPSIPLVREAVQALGESECEIFSIVDLKDAYHSMVIEEDSQKYCGITPYSGSPTYLYQRLAMGLSVSPAMWQSFITTVMGEMPNPEAHLAIMDDCLIHTKRKDHFKEIESLLQALLKHGLKISPKKCQLCRTSCVYMGHNLVIKKNRPCITPWKTRTEAILKLNQPKGVSDVRTFCGMVNFLSMYLKDLQITLAPIYDLIKRKQNPKVTGQPLSWMKEQQEAFEKIKKQLTTPPVLSMPNKTGLFELRSDTSKIGCGAILRQEGNLVGFYSKRLKECCARYSITELELTGLTINISGFKYLLSRRYFKVIVDHSALTWIWKAKTEPKTDRLKKLLEVCMGYNFDLSYEKGASMHCADFLSRHPDNDHSDRGQVIPIAFQVLVEDLNLNKPVDSIMAVTRSMTRAAAEAAPDSEPVSQPLPVVAGKPPEVGVTSGLKGSSTPGEAQGHLNRYNSIPSSGTDVSTVLRRVTQEPRQEVAGIESLMDPVKVEFTGEWSKGPYMQENPIPVWDFAEARNEADKMKWAAILDKKGLRSHDVVTKQIPFQRDFRVLNKIIQNIPLHNFELPISAVQMQAQYAKSPFFKDVYRYCTRGVEPFKRGAAKKAFDIECQKYLVIRGLLFKIELNRDGEERLKLCVPEKYIPLILWKYHDFILAMHQGITKTLLTIKAHFFFPRMHEYVQSYINTCPVCQQQKASREEIPKASFIRIPVTAHPFDRVAMDVKDMPMAVDGSKYLLVCVCEITNYPVAVPMKDQKATTIFNCFFQAVVCDHTCPKVIITDKAATFTGELSAMLYHRLRIKRLLVNPRNKGANRAERYIQTLVNEIVAVVSDSGEHWPAYVKPALAAFRNFVSPTTGFSPYEMVTGRQQRPLSELLDVEGDLEDGRHMAPDNYMEHLQQRKKVIDRAVKSRKLTTQLDQYHKEQRRNPNFEQFGVGDLVLFEYKSKSDAYSGAQKSTMTRPWIGPVKVAVVLDPNKYLLADWSGRIISTEFHRKGLKRFHLREGQELRDVITSLPRMGEEILAYEQQLARAERRKR